MTAQPIRMLVLGTGNWANAHARAYRAMDGVDLVGAVDSNAEGLARFCEEHGVARTFGSVEEALDWGEFDAVSNVTPDAVHHSTTMPLLAAGKHVLCEKPLALSYADAKEMADAAQAAGVVNMVDLTYRSGPSLKMAAEMVRAGEIGQVRHFEASYLQSWLLQPAWGDWKTDDRWLWRLSTRHGSNGVLGDIGIHILDFATHIAGSDATSVSCRLKTFDKAPGNQIGEYVLDANDSCVLSLELENGANGVVHASRFASGHLNDLQMRVFGDKGALDVRSVRHFSTLQACLSDDLETGNWSEIEVAPSGPPVFQDFVSAIRGEGPVDPDFARGASLQRVLDLAVVSDAENSVMKAV